MFNFTNLHNSLNNNTYVLAACNMATIASTKASQVGTHMVSQYDNFKEFSSSDSSVEKTAEISQKFFTGLAAVTMLTLTLDSTLKSASSLSKGKILNSLFYGLIAAGEAAMTCGLTSLTLDPVGAVEFFNQQ